MRRAVHSGTLRKRASLNYMDTKRSLAMWLSAAGLLFTVAGSYGADQELQKGVPAQKAERKSLNPPNAAEPIKPGTLDRPPMAVAPGTMDAPPKPAAPGTLDRNVINPDVQIKKGEKPVPR